LLRNYQNSYFFNLIFINMIKRILLLIALLNILLLANLQAQTPQYRTVLNTNTTGFPWSSAATTVVPFGLKMQLLYTPSDLTPALPSGGGFINRLYFRSSIISASSVINNLKISIGQTSATAFSGTTYFTGLQQCNATVSSTTLTTPSTAGDWFSIDLSTANGGTPYYFNDPTKTLIVEIYFTGKDGTQLTSYCPASAPGRRLNSTSSTATVNPSISTGTASSQPIDIGFDITLPAPCVAPANQPTAFFATPISTSSIDVSFSAASSAPSGYLAVRYPAGSSVSNPINGTAYTVGQSLGLGTVVHVGTGTSFSNTNLLGSSTYDFYIYSYNNTSCAGGPTYLINPTPLTGSASTLGCSSFSGTIPIGPGLPNTVSGGYTSLTNAINMLNSVGLGGNTIFELQSGYNGTASNETFPITISNNACLGVGKQITIRPAAGVTGLSITNPAATATINLNSALNVTFDGRPGGIGSFVLGNNLRIVNTTTGNAFRIENDAKNILIQYCDVMSNIPTANNSSGAGIINIAGTTGTSGNDSITIEYCDLHNAPGGNPAVCIQGWAATGTSMNDNIFIRNNNFYNYSHPINFYAGVSANVGSSKWQITNNKFYQVSVPTMTGSGDLTNGHKDININSSTGNGFQIIGNTIGGNNSNNTGTYTLTGNSGFTYFSIFVNAGSGTNPSDTTQIQGNVFKNISMTNSAISSPTVYMSNIYVFNGLVNVGTSSPNIIGEDLNASVLPSISYTNQSVNYAIYNPILMSSGNYRVENNIIAGIRLAASTVASSAEFQGISMLGGSTVIARNNLIGSLTKPKCIYYANTNTTATTSARMVGMLISNSTAITTSCMVSDNTIANLASENPTTGSAVRGILLANSSGIASGAVPYVISNNIIRDLSSATSLVGTFANPSIVGIAATHASFNGSLDINSNKIYNLVSTSSNAVNAINVVGLSNSIASTGTVSIARNLIYGLHVTALNTNASLTGIGIGTSGPASYNNNMIRLGLDSTGASITTPLNIQGIHKNGAASTNIYFNSIYIGGGNVTSTTAKNSYAFWRQTAGTDDVRNNIFVNNRSNASLGGKHYQAAFTVTSTLTLNYNNYFGSGTGSVMGLNVAADVASYTSGWITGDANSRNQDPKFVNQNGNNASLDLHIQSAVPTPVEATGINIAAITTDYDNEVRSGLTPVDMGADAGNFLSVFACSTAAAGGTASISLTTICPNSTTVLTYAGFDPSVVGYSFQWKVSPTPGGPYTNVIGGTGATTPVYTTAPLAVGTYYYVMETTCATCSPCSINSNQVSVNVTNVASPVLVNNSSQCGPGIPTASVSVGGNGNGQMYWYDAATGGNLLQGPNMTMAYNCSFPGTTTCTGLIGGLPTATLAVNASVANGVLSLHPNLGSQYGSLVLSATGSNSRQQVDFDLTTSGTPGNLADGFSISYSDDGVGNSEAAMNAENGTGSKFKLAFVSYTNGISVRGIYLMYNCTTNEQGPSTPGVLAYSNDTSWINATRHVTIKLDDFGKATILLNDVPLANMNNITMPNYLAQSRTTWRYILKGRTGGISMATSIDNLQLQIGNNSPGYNTYLTPISTTTTFYVAEGSAGGCLSGRTAVTATVSQPPSISIATSPTTICQGNTVSLTASGSGITPSYVWSGGISNGTPFVPSGISTYTVTATASGCSSTSSITITPNPIVNGIASSSVNSICLGQPVTFNASVPANCSGTTVSNFVPPYASANWTLANINSPGTATITTVANPTTLTLTSGKINASLDGVTNYRVVVACAGNISFNWSFTTTDAAVSFTPEFRRNSGAITQFTSYNPSGGNSQNGSQTIAVNAGDTLYLRLLTLDNTGTATLVINSFSGPSAPLTGTATFFTDLTGGTNLNTNAYTITPTSTGPTTYYAAYVTNGTGCINATRTPVTVQVNALPVVSASVNSSPICNGGTATLEATGASSYNWNPGNLTGSTQIVNPSVTQTYTVVGTDANNCSNTSTAQLIVNVLPTIVPSAGQTSICIGGSTTLSATGADTYTWQPGGLTGSPSINPTVTTTYTVTGVDANGCINTATIEIVVNNLPTVSASTNEAIICQGASSTLNGGGASTYDWMPGSLVGSPNVTPAATQTYTVTGTDVNGCSNTSTIEIVVNNLPTITASSVGSPICFGEMDTISASGASTYAWMPGSLTGTPAVNPTSSQVYTVTGTDGNGCENTATIEVVVNALPTVAPSTSVNPICVGAASVLNASGATTYDWMPGGLTGSPSVNPASSQIYTVTGTDGNGCSNTATIELQVNALPIVLASTSNSPICAGNSSTLQGTGADIYDWMPGSLIGSPIVTPSATQIYTLTGTDANGCANTSTIEVVVNNLPIIVASATDSALCEGETTTLSANGANTYDWYPGGLNGTPTVNPSSTQTYTVYGVDANSCSSSNTIEIIVNALPSLTATATPSTVCPGSATILEATGADSYIWEPGTISGASISEAPAATDSYTVTGTDANGCSNTSSVLVTVSNAIVVNVSATFSSICEGESSEITASGTSTYDWMPGNLSGSIINVNPTSTTIYTVTGTDGLCSATATIEIIVNPLPQLTPSGTSPICEGGTSTLSGFGADTYEWMPGNLVGSPSVSPSTTATYTVTGTDANGCSNTASFEVLVNPLPLVSASGTSPICEGGTSTLSGSGADTYEWMPGNLVGSPSVSPSTTATYTVTGTDANGCSNAASFEVVVNPLPQVTANASVSSTCANTSIVLNGGGATSYIWDNGAIDGLPTTISNTTTIYTVEGTDAQGCTNTSSVEIVVTFDGNLSNAQPFNVLSVVGTSSGSNTQPANSITSYYSGSCNLIASISSTGGNLGNTISEVTVESTTPYPTYPAIGGQPFVPRWFKITPANNLPATVTLYVTQDDFNNYNTYASATGWPLLPTGPTDINGINNIRITKHDDAGIGINPIVLTPTSVIWNSVDNYWEITFLTPNFSQFRIHSQNQLNAPLPVRLLSFEGKKLTNSNLLTWVTSSEINNSYFSLQHSNDGANFNTVGKINTQANNGNSNSNLIYNYEHLSPSLGHNYYRLFQTDIDGKTNQLDKVIDIVWNIDGSQVSLYPNPVLDMLQIEIYLIKTANTSIKIMDVSGRMVKQIQFASKAGLNQSKINMSDLANGVYSVQIFQNNDLIQVSRVTKQ
jgi:hypothetical protein